MSNKSLAKCIYCDELYCIECSTHEHWEECCSEECYKNHQIEEIIQEKKERRIK